MGLDIALESENGEKVAEVGDPKNLLHKLLPPPDDESFLMLRFIDWYGDTVFNRLQMEVFLSEWAQVEKKAKTEEEKALLGHIKTFAQKCMDDLGFYLKFYGD